MINRQDLYRGLNMSAPLMCKWGGSQIETGFNITQNHQDAKGDVWWTVSGVYDRKNMFTEHEVNIMKDNPEIVKKLATIFDVKGFENGQNYMRKQLKDILGVTAIEENVDSLENKISDIDYR